MKKLLILSFALCCLSHAKAQEYRPLAEFGADTVAYLQYNFIDRKDRYIGQPFEKLIGDYEATPYGIATKHTYEYAPGANGISWIYGALIWYRWDDRDIPNAEIHVWFSPPHPEYESIIRPEPGEEEDYHQVIAHRMGHLIVEDIKILLLPARFDENRMIIYGLD